VPTVVAGFEQIAIAP